MLSINVRVVVIVKSVCPGVALGGGEGVYLHQDFPAAGFQVAVTMFV